MGVVDFVRVGRRNAKWNVEVRARAERKASSWKEQKKKDLLFGRRVNQDLLRMEEGCQGKKG